MLFVKPPLRNTPYLNIIINLHRMVIGYGNVDGENYVDFLNNGNSFEYI